MGRYKLVISKLPLLLAICLATVGYGQPAGQVITVGKVRDIYPQVIEVIVQGERFLIPRPQVLENAVDIRPEKNVRIKIDSTEFFSRLRIEF